MTPGEVLVITAITGVLAVVTVGYRHATAERNGALVDAVGPSAVVSRDRLRWLDARFGRTTPGRRLAALLAGAGYPTWSPSGVVLAVGAVTVVGSVGAVPLLGRVGGVVVGLALVASAARWLDRRREQRIERIIAQLPEIARLLANATQAGLGLPRALGLAAQEIQEPASSELAQVCAELGVGHGVDGALAHLRERLPSREIAVLSQTLVVQNRAGGALVKALTTISGTLDERRQLRREIKTATVGATFSGYAVIVLALAAVVMVNVLSPGALDAMIGTPLGQLALGVSGALFAVGYVMVRRLSKVAL
ncbi:type II secretion system F family protein [Sanguibacter antarcticus]|uniref:Tight adherence protein B n=1 Tax=Sanguibacter antarcticus TaxID=372484 RepID=A0A2A9E6K6_9MICO|nr:type II secretion system F family protein [Sanguibacter antarcticus]PFG34687.1 tight adherence protein B [Sanguibacter antarcticus]